MCESSILVFLCLFCGKLAGPISVGFTIIASITFFDLDEIWSSLANMGPRILGRMDVGHIILLGITTGLP